MSELDTDLEHADLGDGNGETRQGEHVCPECSESFSSPMRLGLHRRTAHGVVGKHAKKSSRKRPQRDASPERDEKESGRQARRKREVAVTLRELADLAADLRGRISGELPEHLADLIRQDADALAGSISAIAEKFSPLGALVDWTCGKGGMLTIITGFSGLARWLMRSGRRRGEQTDLQVQMQAAYDRLVESGVEPDLALAQVHSDFGVPAS